MHMPPWESSPGPQMGSATVSPVTECWIASAFTQTMVSPGRMVIVGGLKEENWMVLVWKALRAGKTTDRNAETAATTGIRDFMGIPFKQQGVQLPLPNWNRMTPLHPGG